MGGRLIGEQTGTSSKATSFLLTDLLGSVLANFSNTPGSAAVQGNRVYDPYGTQVYQKGSMGTFKGFTGQYEDTVSGLDYYNARYYDPVVGRFISADSVQGNAQGLDPYAYVGGNPVTHADPTGQKFISTGNPNDLRNNAPSTGWTLPNGNLVTVTESWLYPTMVDVSTPVEQRHGYYDPLTDANNSPAAKFARTTGWDTLTQTWSNPHATWQEKANALKQFALTNANNAFQLSMIFSGPEGEGASVAADSLDVALANGREAWGIVARSLNPDDGQTFAMLIADGKEYWGVNGNKYIPFAVNAISKTHSEIDALAQLYQDREIMGISGGNAVMLVDRMPCLACSRSGLISAVRATRLDSLVIYYGATLDRFGNLIPSGVIEILP